MRALFRLGRREAGRHRLRSVLVTALIGLPVAVGVAAMIVVPAYIGWGSSPTVQDADAVVDVSSLQGTTLGTDQLRVRTEEAIARVRRAAPGATTTTRKVVTTWRALGGSERSDNAVPGAGEQQPNTPVEPLVLARQDTGATPGAALLLSGRAPSSGDEVVLAERVAADAGLSVGDRVRLALPTAELEVVGISLDDDGCYRCVDGFVVGQTFDTTLAGTWSRDQRSAQVLVDAAPGTSVSELEAQLAGAGLGFASTSVDDARAVRWARLGSTVGVAFLLVWTGLIAATGLAVGARRRQRELGLLSANGASPSQLRTAVVAEGALIGLVGAVTGAVLGVGLSVALLHWLPSVWDGAPTPAEPTGWLDAAPWVLLVMLCGLAAAVLASRAAANGLARLTPNDLLRGRRPAPRPAPHWFAAGAGSLLVGFVIAEAVSQNVFDRGDPYGEARLTAVMVVLSLAAVTIGLVATVVGASRLLPRLTSFAGVPMRLAGRDLARHGLRVGASCGAVALTLAAAVAAATLFEDYRTTPVVDRAPSYAELPDDVRYLEVTDDGFDLVGDQIVERYGNPELARDLAAEGFDVLTTQTYYAPAGMELCTTDQDPAGYGCEYAFVHLIEDTSQLRPELRRALDAGQPASSRGFGAEVQLDGAPVETLDLSTLSEGDVGSGSMEWVSSVLDPGAVLVGPDGARRLGIDPASPPLGARILVLADRDDRGIEQRVRDSLAGTRAEVFDPSPVTTSAVGWFVAGAIVFVAAVTLLVVLFALALMRIESRSDDGVLAVSGASPSVLRRTQAARAAVMVLMAAIPASIVGWGLLRVFATGGPSDPGGPSGPGAVPMPWWALGVVVVGLPLLAGLLAGVTDRPARRLRLG